MNMYNPPTHPSEQAFVHECAYVRAYLHVCCCRHVRARIQCILDHTCMYTWVHAWACFWCDWTCVEKHAATPNEPTSAPFHLHPSPCAQSSISVTFSSRPAHAATQHHENARVGSTDLRDRVHVGNVAPHVTEEQPRCARRSRFEAQIFEVEMQIAVALDEHRPATGMDDATRHRCQRKRIDQNGIAALYASGTQREEHCWTAGVHCHCKAGRALAWPRARPPSRPWPGQGWSMAEAELK